MEPEARTKALLSMVVSFAMLMAFMSNIAPAGADQPDRHVLIKPGLTAQNVEKELGSPTFRVSEGNRRIWIYHTLGIDSYQVPREGTLTFRLHSEPDSFTRKYGQRSLGPLHLMLKLTLDADGRLQQYWFGIRHRY